MCSLATLGRSLALQGALEGVAQLLQFCNLTVAGMTACLMHCKQFEL